MKADLQEPWIVKEKYGVERPEFVEEIFNVIKEKAILSKKYPYCLFHTIITRRIRFFLMFILFIELIVSFSFSRL